MAQSALQSPEKNIQRSREKRISEFYHHGVAFQFDIKALRGSPSYQKEKRRKREESEPERRRETAEERKTAGSRTSIRKKRGEEKLHYHPRVASFVQRPHVHCG